MRIAAWHIEGFGFFADAEVADLPTGLSVVYGPNESGKSTTLAFLRGALFGFPSGNTKERKYLPWRGGRHGGRLFLEADDGSWVVERFASPASLTVTMPGGEPGEKDDLDRLLGNADKELFRNIFAFNLEELDLLRSLEADAVRDRIFASPQTGAGRSPSEAMKQLDKQRAKLLRPQASAEINDLKKALRDTRSEMRDAQKAAAGYPKAVAESSKLEREMNRLKHEEDEAEAEARRYERLVELWPDWSARVQAQVKLDEIDAPDGVPKDLEERLREVNSEIREATVTVRERQNELDGHEKRLAGIVVDERLPTLAGEAKTLFAEVSAYQASIKRLSDLEGEAKNEERKLAGQLGDMGSGWDRRRVADLDASIPTADEVLAWGERMREAEDLRGEARRAVEDASRRAAELAEERARIEKEIADRGSPPETAELDAADSQVRQLKALMVDRTGAEAKVETATQAVETQRIAVLTMPAASLAGGPPRWAMGAVAVLLGAGAIGMVVTGQLVAALVLGIAALLTAVLAIRGGSAGDSVPVRQGPSTDVAGHVKEAEAALGARREQLERLDSTILQTARSLELSGFPSSLEVEDRAGLLGRQRAARTRVDGLVADLERVSERLQDSAKRIEDLQTRRAEAEAGVETTMKEWGAWRIGKGIPESLAPETVTALFTSVHRCKESLVRLEQVEEDVLTLRGQVEGFEVRAGLVLAAAGVDPEGRGSGLAANLAKLHDKVIEDERARENKSGLSVAIEGTRRDVKLAEEELQGTEGRRAEILAEARVSDEVEFRDVMARIAMRAELVREIEDRGRRIDAAVGLGSSADDILDELATGEVSEWEAARERAVERAEDLDALRDDAVRRHQDAVHEVARIAQSSDVARLETKAESLRHELVDAAVRWQVVTLARALVEQTLSRFEEKHQGPVVERASALFKGITGNHYETLFAREGVLEVINGRGERIDVGSLSTGAAQQLYLCMRFGLAEEFASRRTSLPLIMDEVLVNFDPERARRVAEAISDVAERHQVLVFTCHPETVEMMQQVCGEVCVVELERFGTKTADAVDAV